MMFRHTLQLWTDEGSRSILLDWKAESVDLPEKVIVADNVELRGSQLWISRQVGTLFTLALLRGPVYAAARVRELVSLEELQEPLF